MYWYILDSSKKGKFELDLLTSEGWGSEGWGQIASCYILHCLADPVDRQTSFNTDTQTHAHLVFGQGQNVSWSHHHSCDDVAGYSDCNPRCTGHRVVSY